jgi:hypothetical protein
MLKAMCAALGVTPEQIMENFEQFQKLALSGIATIEKVEQRLDRIEQHLGIVPIAESPLQLERLEHG